jgi:GTP-binding protein
MSRPIVAIVGRPNVGKSSLFNRIVGKRHSVVDSEPGVTRDRVTADAEWNRREFILVDTGGLVPGTSDQMELHIIDQVELALEQATLVVFLTDGQTGVTDLDAEVGRLLRKKNCPALLVVNKIDMPELDPDLHAFHSLGMGTPVPVSAMSGRHVGDMLDQLVKRLPPEETTEEIDRGIAIAFLGRPNVGKSSLVNALVGSPRVVVDNVPGTTRDAIDTHFLHEGQAYTLIDTAGLRRRKNVWKTQDAIEYFSILRTVSAIERCDVAVLVIEAMEHLVRQDNEILERVTGAGKALVIAANKWDTVPDKTDDTAGTFMKELWTRNPFTAHVPVSLISAGSGLRIERVLGDVQHAYGQWTRRVQTKELNEWLRALVRTNPPPISKAGTPRLSYVTQVTVRPPTFVFFVNNPDMINTAAERYIERSLREAFGFAGTPIKLLFRKKK